MHKTCAAQNWEMELRAWAASHHGVETPVDYDRESIYAEHREDLLNKASAEIVPPQKTFNSPSLAPETRA
jgi:hypothetical protein